MNRRQRREQDNAARARSRALSSLAGNEEALGKLLKFVAETPDPALVQTVLLRLAYAAVKRGRITKVQARLFGARV